MPYLVDTNILLRLLQRNDPDYSVVRKALETLWSRGEQLCYTSQNLVEFWNVCTRPVVNNGFGLTVFETDRRARLIEGRFRLLPDGDRIHAEWRRLVVAHSVMGVRVHDARLVAYMVVHGVGSLLTLNSQDFKRYKGITATHPMDVVSGNNR